LRGVTLRIFTAGEEAAISDFIRDVFLRPGRLFTDRLFKACAMQGFLSKDELDPEIPAFNASNGFVYNYKGRNGFRSRRAHMKRRPQIEADAEVRWVSEIRDLLQREDCSRVVNDDETSWRLYPTGLMTWAGIGEEDAPVQVKGNLKECVTIMATVTAEMKKTAVGDPCRWQD
jgi:hypothetical protein